MPKTPSLALGLDEPVQETMKPTKLNLVAAACKLQAEFVLKMRLRTASALVELLNVTDKPVECWSDIVVALNFSKLVDDSYSSGNSDLIVEATAALRNVNKRVVRGNFPLLLESERETLVQLLEFYSLILHTISYSQYVRALDKLNASL